MGEGVLSKRMNRALAAAFDPVFYRTTYEDIALSGVNPFSHYTETGWREGRDPAPWFSGESYLARYPETAGEDPFLHYLREGWRKGFEPSGSAHRSQFLERAGSRLVADEISGVPVPVDADLPPGLTRRAARELAAAAFDSVFYLSSWPDVAAAGQDPLEHFLLAGWREGRDPSPDFCGAAYLEANPDLAGTGINPFLHWLAVGQAEGRPQRFELGYRGRIVTALTPLVDRMEAAGRAAFAIQPGSAHELNGIIAQRRPRHLHVTFSHDDAFRNVGGLQFCIQRESAELARRGIDHLHLFPPVPWPTLRPCGHRAPIGVSWNGRTLGNYSVPDISAALSDRQGRGKLTFALHSLLGHEVGETLDLLSAAGARRGLFWVHDFTGLCAGYHLMRDNMLDCGAPPAGSAACGICVFGPARHLHLSSHRRLFEALDLTLVGPSQAALDVWNAAPDAPFVRDQRVHPHARLAPTGRRAGGDPDAPLVVAFMGIPTPYKGWPVFEELAGRFRKDPRYRFVRLSSVVVPGAPAEHIPVSVSVEAPDAMRKALEGAGVDVAVLWSLGRETFSFAAYEAAAAGAAILTGPDSGNVAAFTRAGGHGLVLPDEATLFAQFESGAVRHLSRASRNPDICDIAYSGMSVDLLEALS